MLLIKSDLFLISVYSAIVCLVRVHPLQMRCKYTSFQGCNWLKFDKFPMQAALRQQSICCAGRDQVNRVSAAISAPGRDSQIMPPPLPFFDALVMSVLRSEYPPANPDPLAYALRPRPVYYAATSQKSKLSGPRVGRKR
ncbi:uncharacterized protein LOC129584146 [Paramacrobiotus metropolitanus]|uniref:uncharacterized protein LOC129584146 n=1 Tax=Paramacrobiotus metropolitanus TaxID=2943436 RepID=UPI0024459223|nr:uncharacterized protein LOC129584146 [Paramacrobiotus metropolitanus]